MSKLQDNLDDILTQKSTYLLPENIKKDVTILGVTGTLESGGSGDVKLFDTVEHMQADPNPQEGDLAVVYREETNPSTYYFEGLYEYSNNSYNLVQSQLNAVQGEVYQGTFYGANGVQTGTLTTNISNVFTDTNAEVYAKIQTYYNSLTPRVLTDQDKTINTDTIIIPCKSDGTPLLDTSSVTTMNNMFNRCTNLTSIPLLNTNNVTDMSSAFRSCPSLTSIPLLDTSSVTTMISMFRGCTSLTSIPLLDTSNVTIMGLMFQDCINLTSIPLLNTSSVTNMQSMFQGCTNLTTIPLLDTSSATNMTNMFKSCGNLSNTSLDNILAMCTNSAVSSNKTLAKIGLTQEQATICTTLSNYQAFLNAGWTTGYSE